MSNEWVVGIHAVSDALASGRGQNLLICGKNPRFEALEAAARQSGIRVRSVSTDELDRHSSGARHQGIALEVAPFPYAERSDLDKAAGPVIALDGVEDPGNLGAIIRSTYALGGAGVVIPKHGAAPVTPGCERAAAGAASHLPIVCVTNLGRALDAFKAAGRWVYGATADGHHPIDALDLRDDPVIVLGSEAKGLRPGVLKRCDETFFLPMVRPFDSLNVSVSAALCLDAVRRQH
jgi:23S rRNA (guanosine2251-2'-O)-methyltransferase